ncbi:hypothetical protein M673_10240 [Aureimonas sp. AU20]|nr:hypothetical protein M673_10240 [Aureimonas sp. AU20]
MMSAVRPIPLQTFAGARAISADQSGDSNPTVVFDLDGTLVDTAPDLAASLNHCLSRVGLPPLPLDVVRPHAGHGAQAMLREAYRLAARPLSTEELAEQTRCFLAHYEAHIAVESALFPGGLAMLDRLAQAGLRLAICTNKTEHLARRLLDEMGLAARFAAICGADTFSARKPDPVHLLGTVERAGGEVGSAIMVGDTDTDIQAARAAGLPSILVLFGYDPGPTARSGASRSIERFADLTPELIDSMLAKPERHVKAI